MKMKFVTAKVATVLLMLSIGRISVADISLEIQDIMHDQGTGSFLIYADPDVDQDFSLGTYSVNVKFDGFSGFDFITVDPTNLMAGMDEAGSEFGTTDHPISLAAGDVIQFVGFGSGLLPSAGAALFQVDFDVEGAFDNASSFNVMTVDSNPAAPIAAAGISYVANQPLIFDSKRVLGSGLLCDVDANGVCEAADIDLLNAQIRSGAGDLAFDLNGDGTLNNDDRDYWIVDLMNTYAGDSDLDGVFGTRDLIAVFQAGQYEDTIDGNSSWSTGDWDGDKDFGTSDLIYAFQQGGFELGPRGAVASVPEPTSSSIVFLAFTCLMFANRKRLRK